MILKFSHFYYLGTDYLLSKHIYFLLFTTKEVESVYFPNRISSEGKEPVVIQYLSYEFAMLLYMKLYLSTLLKQSNMFAE